MAKVQLKAAATVVCLRQSSCSRSKPIVLTKTDLLRHASEIRDFSSVAEVFGQKLDSVSFESGWQVLMGQREVKNWMRSTRENDVLMRYPGEWNFPGGAVDPGETLEQAARRELEEELMLKLPQDARLRLISVKQTRAIRGTSNLMYNFVALADDLENKWLRDLQLDSTNEALSRKREQHSKTLASGEFWEMSFSEKELVAPETRRFCWHDLPQAVSFAFTSMLAPMLPVDSWQESEFQRYGVVQRDFTFIIMQTCLDMESMPSVAAIRRSTILDPETETARIQWIFQGTSLEEADSIFWERVNSKKSLKLGADLPTWMQAREKQRLLDEETSARL